MKTSILRSAAIVKSRYEEKTAYVYASQKFVSFICVHNILYIYILHCTHIISDTLTSVGRGGDPLSILSVRLSL